MMQSKRFLNTFPLPPGIRAKLFDAGYSTVEDLVSMGPLSLSKGANISYVEATDVFELLVSAAQVPVSPLSLTAFELFQQEQEQMNIVTFSQALDRILDGGIPLGKTLEICGAPGTGKTQLCLQLCVDVQILEGLGGVGGEAVYIDTEGSFSVDRLLDMAQGCLQHCHIICQKDPSLKEYVSTFTVESILNGVHYYRCCDYVELVALVNVLPDFLQKHPKVRLVVIDSIAFHFRYGFEGNLAARSRILTNLSQTLVRIAFESQLAVVLTNQMTTRIDPQGQSGLVPSLGEGWGHSCALRLVLFWQDGQRKALLIKSSSHREDVATFQIMGAGIRDVVENIPTTHQDASVSPQQSTKRPKLNH